MKNNRLLHPELYLLSILLIFMFYACSTDDPNKADMILMHGKVYTLDSVNSWATSVAIKNGLITYVGPDEGAEKFIGNTTKVVDLQGKLVLPGLHDAHTHPIMGGEELDYCQLNGLLEQKEIVSAISEYAKENPDATVIRGRGWELPAFPNGNPKKELLDSIVPDRPVILASWDHHSTWVNSKALEMAGITKDTPDPKNGRIERDPATGAPSGTLRETASKLVYAIIPKKPESVEVDYLRKALKIANAFGITAMTDASVSEAYLKAYKTLDDSGELTARVVTAIRLGTEKNKSVKKLMALRDAYRGEKINTNAIKVFADGVPEAKTAALLAPYHTHDGKEDYGILNYEPLELKTILDSLDQEGFQIHIHALGDKAAHVSLNALEGLDSANRHQMAHLQIVAPEDIPRFGALNVIANFQPFWAKADPLNVQTIIPLVGEERSRQMYPMASIKHSGGMVVAGSDWPVSTLNPWHGIQVGVTRSLIEEESDPWIATESLSLPAILAAYTKNAAFAMHHEAHTGTITVKKFADLIVVNQNIFEIPSSTIHKTKVMLTLLEGNVVYEDKETRLLGEPSPK